MRLIIEARLDGDGIDPTDAPIPLAVIDRHDDVLDQLGLSLTECRELLAAAQSVLVSGHTPSWVTTQDYCHSVTHRYAIRTTAPLSCAPCLAKWRSTVRGFDPAIVKKRQIVSPAPSAP